MTVTTVAVAQPFWVRTVVMAHYKRGKSRTQSSPHTSQRLRDEITQGRPGRWWKFTGAWPRWHDILYHSRPRRRFDTKMAGDIAFDRIDAEVAIWAADKKPHKYYW